MIRPPALHPGDIVALISPAGPLADEAELVRACEAVRSLGFEPRPGRNAARRDGYLAGSDDERARDFNEAARDPQVRGIFALRGGYGTMRILHALDYEALRNDPKVILGYSDLTAILNAVTARAGLVTFHGPVAALSQFTPEVVAALRRAVCIAEPLGTFPIEDGATITGGRASGILRGGNLSLLAGLVGTPYAIALREAILFVEEVGEAPYKIDRMLTQLRLSGAFAGLAGIAIGQCRDCDVDSEHVYAQMPLARTLADRLGDLGVPVFTGARIGHIDEQWTIPIGARASIDAGVRTLRIDEPAVS
ncbi:MAG TPA: LD-carboxypeptidase [Candidatus Baltobacteraceae bacterium]